MANCCGITTLVICRCIDGESARRSQLGRWILGLMRKFLSDLINKDKLTKLARKSESNMEGSGSSRQTGVSRHNSVSCENSPFGRGIRHMQNRPPILMESSMPSERKEYVGKCRILHKDSSS
ncbi:hypothetical protein AKJ16_DCAP12531 [Drosera capensis]